MKQLIALGALLAAFGLFGPAHALTPEEVIKLKKAGVSDAVIQKMLEQERSGNQQPGPVVDSGDEVVYRAGQGNRARMQRNAEHERWKEEKALDAAGNVIIDQRRVNPPMGSGKAQSAKE